MPSVKDWGQEVADTKTGQAFAVLFEAVRQELAAIKGTSVISTTTLSKGSTAENVANTAFAFRINGMSYAKAAVAAGTALGITDTINTGTAAGLFFGGFAAQINAAGTITFKSVSTDQVYTSEAAAYNAALAIAPTAANVIIGVFVVGAKTGAKWTAGTDDLTPTSDCNTVTFWSTPVANFLTV